MLNTNTIFKNKIILVFFIFITLLVYFRVLNGEFILDDQALIAYNPKIKYLITVLSYFSSSIINTMEDAVSRSYFYRPIQMLTYFLNYQLGGLNVIGYHFINLLIHCLNAYLLFLILNKLFAKFELAIFSGIIFILHPLNISSVSYISGRADLLSAFFILSSTLCYIDYLKYSAQKKYIIAIACCILALLSRENGLILPFFLLLSGLFLKIKKSRLIFSIMPFFLLVILYLFLRFSYLDPRVYVYYDYASSLNIITKLLNFIYLIKNYMLLFFLPKDPHMFRMASVMMKTFSFEIIPLALFVLLAVLFIYCKRKNKIIIFSVLWILLGFFPLWYNMFIRLTLEGNRLNMAESWSYISCMGFSSLLAYGLLRHPNKYISYLLALTVILFYGGITYAHQKYWSDGLMFYRYNLKFSPHNYILQNNFVSVLLEHKYFKEAEEEANRYIEHNPNSVIGYNMLAEVYHLGSGRDKEAMEQLKKALTIDPSQMWARRALNDLNLKTGEVNPKAFSSGSVGLTFEEKALYYLNKGDISGAADVCSKGIEEKPTARIYVLSGVVFLKAGKLKSAINVFRRALDLEPRNLDALINLSRCYQLLNKKQEVLRLQKEIEKITKNR